MALNKVVLPAPFAPKMARFSPARTDKETSSTARKAPNARVTFSKTKASEDMRGTSLDEVTTGRAVSGELERKAVMDAIVICLMPLTYGSQECPLYLSPFS